MLAACLICKLTTATGNSPVLLTYGVGLHKKGTMKNSSIILSICHIGLEVSQYVKQRNSKFNFNKVVYRPEDTLFVFQTIAARYWLIKQTSLCTLHVTTLWRKINQAAKRIRAYLILQSNRTIYFKTNWLKLTFLQYFIAMIFSYMQRFYIINFTSLQ